MAASGPEKAAYAAAGAAAVLAVHALYQLQQRRSSESALASRPPTTAAVQAAPATVPAELEQELYSRNVGFFGEAGFANIREAFVIIVGLGGVGSHAAHMLARSGVRRLRLIDFDQVTLSSLNRHAVATWADVGTSKAQALKDRLMAIVPGADIDARAQVNHVLLAMHSVIAISLAAWPTCLCTC
jgi:tRNA threonylcarbamoyladenosine dehydratase